MAQSYWIWYPGDLELYFALKQNFSRVERGYGWPAFWKSEGFRNRVVFRRSYQLESETSFKVWSQAVGYVLVNEKKYPFGREIVAPAGEVSISVHAGRIEAVPGILIEGDVIFSDGSWLVSDYAGEARKAGFSRYFTSREQDLTSWPYKEKRYEPVSVTEVEGGLLFAFETELTAALELRDVQEASSLAKGDKEEECRVYCGESMEEALDTEHGYYSWTFDPASRRTPVCALRYAYLKGVRGHLSAIHTYVDIPVVSSFTSDDEELNQIWSVAAHTFSLCSGVFFIDGVKRDKWLWSGDAYQSLFVNQYLMADAEIERRTLTALRGNDPITTHINTILDYSMLWLVGVAQHVRYFEDQEYLSEIWPKCLSMMEFLLSQTDENGFILGREGDWIFIDWADLDKEGAFGAEQMLLAGCYRAMEEMSEELGVVNPYAGRFEELKQKLQRYFWDEEKGAFIDSYSSGKRHVSRQTNLLAIRFGVVTGQQEGLIFRNVILSQDIPAIRTPYFAFFELDALGKAGRVEELLNRMRSYWGGMLKAGAVTFWEEYDPSVPEEEQYDMYGDRFGKSLCHAWAASPIYLMGRYLLGLKHEKGGAYTLEPRWELLPEDFEAVLPVSGGKGRVRISRHGESREAGIMKEL